MDLNIETTNPPRPTDITTVKGPASSNATQAPEVEEPQQAEISQALSLAIPTASTPLYTALLEKLANTDDESIIKKDAQFAQRKKQEEAAAAAQAEKRKRVREAIAAYRETRETLEDLEAKWVREEPEREEARAERVEKAVAIYEKHQEILEQISSYVDPAAKRVKPTEDTKPREKNVWPEPPHEGVYRGP